jgi:hypothetical protein
MHEVYLGRVLFCVASLINIRYGVLEFQEMGRSGLLHYLESVQNWFDVAFFLNMVLLPLLLLLGSALANPFGAFGTVLLLPKVSQSPRAGGVRVAAMPRCLPPTPLVAWPRRWRRWRVVTRRCPH